MKKLLILALVLSLTFASACGKRGSGTDGENQTTPEQATLDPDRYADPPPSEPIEPQIIEPSPAGTAVPNYVEFDFITIGFFNNDPTLLEFRAPQSGLGQTAGIANWGFENFRIMATQGVDFAHRAAGNEDYGTEFASAPRTNLKSPIETGSYWVTGIVFPVAIPAGGAAATLTVEGEGELLLEFKFTAGGSAEGAGTDSATQLSFRLTNIFEEVLS
jgi:hypothetical protein